LSLKSFGDPIPTPRSVFEEEKNSSRVSNVVIRLKGETKSHKVSNKETNILLEISVAKECQITILFSSDHLLFSLCKFLKKIATYS
jgi:hypothetical protein